MLRYFSTAALAATLMSAAAGPAMAETFQLGDLGEVPSRRICMIVAQEVLEAYVSEHGGHSTSGEPEDPDNWTYYGWDLRPGNNDVVISCPIVSTVVNAFFTIHSSGDDDSANADVAAERLRELWKRLY